MLNRSQHRGGRRRRQSAAAAGAFTLIEIMIVVVILAILATIVIPHFSNASVTARENMLKDELRYLRTQIIVYKAQHRDIPPGYPNGDMAQAPTEAEFVAQMSKHTDEKGAVSASASAVFKYGPYLSSMPSNPLSNLKATQIVGDSDPWPTADGATYGWFYRPLTGDIMANSPGADASGQAYSNY